MRIGTLIVALICCSSLLLMARPGWGQNLSEVEIQLTVKKQRLDKVLKTIEQQTPFLFVVDASLAVDVKDITFSKRSSVKGILDAILHPHGLIYEQDGKYIVIRRGDKPVLPAPVAPTPEKTTADLPPGRITGRITDPNGAGLEGATIMVKGRSSGVMTDSRGYFTLNAAENDTLLISYTGFSTREEPVRGRKRIQIQLLQNTSVANDVVVIGYGTQRKKDVTGAITSVKPDQLDRAAQPSLTQMLQGQAAGLTVFNTAQPGGSSTLLIRGATSTGAGNDPLIVIDGFPVVTDIVEPNSGNQYTMGSRSFLNDINVSDIGSIDILKDASSSAIYGARGANGVIQITTKRGRPGLHVDYDASTAVQTIAKRPEVLNATNFMIQQNEYLYTNYLEQYGLAPYGNNSTANAPPYTPLNSATAIAAAGKGTDWYSLITQPGLVNQQNLSISQGNENIKNLISFNYYNQQGVIKGSGLDRYTLRLNQDQKLTKWWDYSLSLTAAMMNEKNSTLGDGRDATAGIIESALDYSPVTKAAKDPLTGYWLTDPKQSLLPQPLSLLNITDNTRTQRVLSDFYTDIYFTPWIWLKLNAGEDIRSGVRQSYYPKSTMYGQQVNGEADINNASRQDYVVDVTANLKKDFGDNQHLQGLIGYSYNNQNNSGAYEQAQNFATDDLLYDALQAGQQIPIVSSYRGKHILISYFTRWQYNLNDKYLLALSARIDGSDRFGVNNRYAFFPSGSFAWRLSKENFMQNIHWLSDLKLRVGVGQTGNENIANDAASEYYAFGGDNYYYNGQLYTGVNLAKYANPNLKWESTTEYDLGVDFGILRNRLTGSADVYYKTVSNLLTNRALPSSSIINNIPWNAGSTEGRGLELTLNSVNLTGPLRWTTLLTYTAYRDNWLHRDPLVIVQPYQKAHDPLTAIYGLVADGIKQAGESTPTQPNLLPGQQKYKDINSLDAQGHLAGKTDGKINQADEVYKGTTAPKFSVGLNNTFEFKGFDLSAFFYASVGALKWPYTRMEHSVYGSYGTQRFKDDYNFLTEVANRWTPTHTNTSMPSGDVNSYDVFGAPYWQDDTYFRLKTLTLGYNFSRNLIGARWLKSSRLYVSVQNVFTITSYVGMDPEVENDRAAYPQQRTFTIGGNFGF